MTQILFDKDNSYYLLVGVGKREIENDSDSMAVSADDALILKRALHAFNIFLDEKIPPLVNEKATSSEIREKLEYLANLTQKEPADLVIIFFSGHGYKTEEDRYYLICRDSTIADVEKTAINANKFVEMLQAVNCKKMLVLLDCCHAKGMGMNDEVIPFDKEVFNKYPNRVILTACDKAQLSYLSKPVSLFTYALIEGLGGKFLNEGNTEVSILNLAMDVRERVVALSKKIGKLQQPQLYVFKESGTTDFTLVRYPTGGLKEIKLLQKEVSSLWKEDGKEPIITDVKSTQDENYRNQFNWMVSNNITIKDNQNGLFLTGSNGNNIFITNGLSLVDFKEILNSFHFNSLKKNEVLEKVSSSLFGKEDQISKELGEMVKSIEKKSIDQFNFGDGPEGDEIIESAKNFINNLVDRMIDIERILSIENRPLLKINISKITGLQGAIINEFYRLLNFRNGVAIKVFLDSRKRCIVEITKRIDKLYRDMDKQQQKAVAEDTVGDEEFEEQKIFMGERIVRLTLFIEIIQNLS